MGTESGCDTGWLGILGHGVPVREVLGSNPPEPPCCSPLFSREICLKYGGLGLRYKIGQINIDKNENVNEPTTIKVPLTQPKW